MGQLVHGRHAPTFRVEILDTDLVALAKHCPWFVNLCLRERERQKEREREKEEEEEAGEVERVEEIEIEREKRGINRER
jgi:hypothetical protein